MNIQLGFDDNLWLRVPKAFPTEAAETQSEWEDRVLDGMREAWDGRMSREQEAMARGGLQHGIDRIDPRDSITLQFWPLAAPVNVIVHFVAGEIAAGEHTDAVPLESGTYVGAPVVVPFSTDLLGDGVEVRYVAAIDTDHPLAFGGVNYLFRNEDAYVLVVAEATLPSLVGLMLEPLRKVVRSIQPAGLADGWRPATLDSRVLTSISVGDAWPIDEGSGDR